MLNFFFVQSGHFDQVWGELLGNYWKLLWDSPDRTAFWLPKNCFN